MAPWPCEYHVCCGCCRTSPADTKHPLSHPPSAPEASSFHLAPAECALAVEKQKKKEKISSKVTVRAVAFRPLGGRPLAGPHAGAVSPGRQARMQACTPLPKLNPIPSTSPPPARPRVLQQLLPGRGEGLLLIDNNEKWQNRWETRERYLPGVELCNPTHPLLSARHTLSTPPHPGATCSGEARCAMTGPGGGPSKGLIELGAGGRTEGHNVGPEKHDTC
ncbi:unnamed protein product [Gadus morhua 'NCC']